MKYLDLTPDEPAANLALDEALLDWCEERGDAEEILRFWAPQRYFVVVGYANKLATEVNLEECARREIPVLRRCSGGGTVLQGQGCLNYSLILRIRDELAGIPQTNTFIMDKQRSALKALTKRNVEVRGHTDLAIDGVKFSGNAQRRKKHFLIFHGTFLLNFDLPLIEACLRMPSKEPDYRQNRSHQQFLTNLGCTAEEVKSALKSVWSACEPLVEVPDYRALQTEKYDRPEWNTKF
jgi:lipoate-protein ligase A